MTNTQNPLWGFFALGWANLILCLAMILLILGSLTWAAYGQETDQFIYPDRIMIEAEVGHLDALTRAETAVVTVHDLIHPGQDTVACFPTCPVDRVEITIFQDLETGSFGVMWTDAAAFMRVLQTDFGGNTDAEFLASAQWTLTAHGVPDHVRPVGSVMRDWVIPSLYSLGHDDPVSYLQAEPWRMAEILTLEVIPFIRKQMTLPEMVMAKE